MNKNYYFKKQRTGLMLVGGFMSLMMGAMMTPAVAGLIAQITNSVNSLSTGSLKMTEKNNDGSVTCESTNNNSSNTATCATINKYGGTTTPLVPGGSNETTIKISNTGTVDATAFTVKGGECTVKTVNNAASSVDLCDKVNITIKSGNTEIYKGKAKAFAAASATDILGKLSKTSVAKSEEVILTIVANLDASVDNTYQGLKLEQPIVWQFGA